MLTYPQFLCRWKMTREHVVPTRAMLGNARRRELLRQIRERTVSCGTDDIGQLRDAVAAHFEYLEVSKREGWSRV